jgi:poly(beta-D-mannuronate) lyase
VDLMIGGNYKSGWPGSQRMLIPEDNLIANNTIVKTGGGTAVAAAVADSQPPLDAFHFKPNRFENNVVFGGRIKLDPVPAGFVIKDPGRPAVPNPLTASDTGPDWMKAK